MNRFSATLCGLLLAAAPALAASPIDGTWKADVTTAKLSTKPDVFATKDGSYECTSCTPPYKIAADGKPHPVAGRDYWDAASIAVVDANTLQFGRYRKGSQISSTKLVASPDGQMLTWTSTSSDNASGKSITNSSMSKRTGPAPAGSHATSGSWVQVAAGAQIADESLTATMSMVGDTVTMKLGTGESYVAKLGGPQVPMVGDRAGATVALAKNGNGFVETDYVRGKAIGTYSYMPIDATTMKLTAVDLKAGTTDEYTLKKQ
jgi:hypothetical protein